MISQELLDQINAAWTSALARYNRHAKAPIADVKANSDFVCKYLRSQNIPHTDWIHEQIFDAAIAQCADDLETIRVETTEERNRRLAKRDAADGSRRYIKDGEGSKAADIKSPMDEITNLLTGKKHEETSAVAKTVFPSLNADPDHLENMSAEDKALLKKLTGPETRIWMAKLRQKIAEEAQAAASVRTGNVRLKGEARG
jgi:hypothetical protein